MLSCVLVLVVVVALLLQTKGTPSPQTHCCGVLCCSSGSVLCGVPPVDTVDSITPDKVRGLRDMLNSSAMDIMYYTSPLYRDEVRGSQYYCSLSELHQLKG